ncbi:MAG TPA: N-6 DNA methylase, partial [Ktedonobacteraceae bacterium]|nr:N-6 DNA methylase [Ktedonobacteraceae bacterium]
AREHEGGFCQRISIFGQERNSETVRFCKMNLTMHNLVGEIQIANSYYEDPYNAAKRFDYILANPPFNVRGIDIARLAPGRFPLGIPRGDNGNYLWINLFHNALNETGRAGFIMPNSASDARDSKREVRQRLIETGTVDVMIAISPHFHYNVTLPCTLWFLDEGKRKNKRRNQVLFIDARYIYHQVDRAHRAFQLEDIEFIADIVRLYRGESPETHHSSEHRLKEVFPDRVYADVPGLCTIATLDEIARQDWSLNVGRYVKVNENRIPAKLPISLERQTVFICYSRKDQKYLEMLRLHLTPLKRSNDVEIWADTDIAAGENWREKIKEVISRAGVTVLLISPAFLASKYIDEDELPPLLDAASTRGTKIIPILLSPCLYTSSQLANFQLANERPLLAMSQYQKDATLVKVAQRVEDILRNIAK